MAGGLVAKAKQAKAPVAEAMNVINKRFDPECAIGDITEHPRNAREGDVGALHVSIDHNGFYGALIVQESTGHILSGNHRYKAAVQKGAATIPVIWVDCDDAAALRIMVSDNRTSDIAAYSNDALAELLESIKIDETGLGFLGTGWDEEAYQNLLNDLSGSVLGEESKSGLTEDDAVPEVPDEPVSKLGDLWILGNHRVLCGDSTSAKDVARLMAGDSADLVFTDPPYGIDYQDVKKKHKKIANDASLSGIGPLMRHVLSNKCPMYICCNWKCFSTFESAMLAADRDPKCCIVWDKRVRVQNLDRFYKQHEFIIYHGPFGGQETVAGDVWQCDREVRDDHPTAKPVEIIVKAVGYASKPNDLVQDLFGGAGSTLIACEKTNRKARLMELEPGYVDVILTRWQEFTGQSATLDSDGRTFVEVKANGRAAAIKSSV